MNEVTHLINYLVLGFSALSFQSILCDLDGVSNDWFELSNRRSHFDELDRWEDTKVGIRVFLVHLKSLFLYLDCGEVNCVLSAISKQYGQ